MRANIQAMGAAYGDTFLTNEDFVKKYNYRYSAAEIEAKTLIKSRYFASHGSVKRLGVEAVEDLIRTTGKLSPDLVIVTSYTSEQACPALAATLARDLGLTPTLTFDVQGACGGFVVALDLADSLIATGKAKDALIVSSEVHSRCLPFTGPSAGLGSIFADAAAAAYVVGSERAGIVEAVRRCEPELCDQLMRTHIPFDGHDDLMYFGNPGSDMTSGGMKLTSRAVALMGELVREVLDKGRVKIGDVQHFVSHQPNAALVAKLMSDLGVRSEQATLVCDRTGNCASATLPLSWCERSRTVGFKPGDLAVVVGHGAGHQAAAFLMRV